MTKKAAPKTSRTSGSSPSKAVVKEEVDTTTAIVEAYRLSLDVANAQELPKLRAEISDVINRLHHLLEESK